MALIKTIAEIKEVLPKFIPNNLDSKVLPNFDQAEAKYIVPLIGINFYNSLVSKYNAGTLSGDEVTLVKKLRLVECAYAFRDEQAFGYLTISESGIRKTQQGGTGEVRKWEFEKLSGALTTLAADGTETVLQYLYEKRFALWTASDVYAGFQKLLIRTGTDFSSKYNLFQPMRTFFALRPLIQDAQDLYLKQGIGAGLLTYLVALDTIPDGLKQGYEFLKKSLCYFSICEACSLFDVQFSDAGFTVLNASRNPDVEESGRNAADANTLQLRMQSSNTRGQDFLCLAQNEFINYYKTDGTPVEFKTVLDAGPLKDFLTGEAAGSGNDTRKIFVL